MKPLQLFNCLVAAVLLGCSDESDHAQHRMKDYRDPVLKFLIRYPDSWAITEVTDSTEIVDGRILWIAPHSQERPNGPGVMISVEETPPESTALTAGQSIAIHERMAKADPNSTLIKAAHTCSLGGGTFHSVVFLRRKEGLGLGTQTVYVKQSGEFRLTLMSISFTDAEQKEVDAIMQTLLLMP
jgi:hypothetical protein